MAAGGAIDGVCGTAVQGTVCRSPLGACDAPETCNGLDDTCPDDVLRPSNTICREAAGPCDVDERCTGTEPGCPRDRLADVGEVCRASVGECDVVDVCDGLSGECPPDEVKARGVQCRGRFGVCDVAEACDGERPLCPADGFKPFGSSCRAPSGACDAEEVCLGISPDCPADAFVDDGTACIDGDVCTEGDSCLQGRCTSGPVVCQGGSPSPAPEPRPFDDVPATEAPETPSSCASASRGATLPFAGFVVFLAVTGRRGRRRRAGRQGVAGAAFVGAVLLVTGLGAGAAAAQVDDADGDGVQDTLDRCALGDDTVDSDADGTPDACDCAPADPAIHPAALDVCDGTDTNCDLRIDRRLAFSARGAELVGLVGRGLATKPSQLTRLKVPAGTSRVLVEPVSFFAPNHPIYFETPLELRTVSGTRRVLVLLDRVPTAGDNDTVIAFSDGTRVVTYGLYDLALGYGGRIGAAARGPEVLNPRPVVTPSPDVTFVDDVEDTRFVITFTATAGRTEATARGARGTVAPPAAITGSEALDPNLPWTFMLVGNTRDERYTVSEVEVWQTVPDDDGERDLDGDGYSEICDCNDSNPAVHPGARESCAVGDNDCRITAFDQQETIFSKGGAGMLGEIANLTATTAPTSSLTVQDDVLRITGTGLGEPAYRVPLGATVAPSLLTLALGAGPENGSVIIGLTDGTRYRGAFARRTPGRLDIFPLAGTFVNGKVGFTTVTLASLVSRQTPDGGLIRATFDGNALRVQVGGPEVSLTFGGSPPDGGPLEVFFAGLDGNPMQITGLDITVPGADADNDGICDLSDACDGFDGDVDADGDGVFNLCDCNDNVASIRPYAEESCDAIDQDCDGRSDLISQGGTAAELVANIAQGRGRVIAGSYAEELGIVGDSAGRGRVTLRTRGDGVANSQTGIAVGGRILNIQRFNLAPGIYRAVLFSGAFDPVTRTQTSLAEVGIIGVDGGADITLDYVNDADGVRLIASPPFSLVRAPHTELADGGGGAPRWFLPRPPAAGEPAQQPRRCPACRGDPLPRRRRRRPCL